MRRFSPDELAYLKNHDAPELADAVEPENPFLWQAYHHLLSSRGMNGAIPFMAVTDYCDFAGITCPVQKNRLARAILTMDNAERSINGGAEPQG